MMVDRNIALQLFEMMVLIRNTEETIAHRYTEWEMRCPTHLSTGQEAVATGVCMALRKDDFVMSTHRAHAHYLAKGGDLNKMVAEIYGKATGCTAGKGGSMHLIDKSVGFMGSTSIVGNTIPLAVGLGFSIQLQKTDQVSCVFFGDAAVEEGVFYESVNFAVLKNLPVLFICENNLYSVYSPLKVRQPENRVIYKMVHGFGIESEYVNGNDVIEVYKKISKAVEKIRSGSGPQFLEFSTYRWREHCGPYYDNDLGYRTEKEFIDWKKKDPVKKMISFLLENSIKNIDEIESIQKNTQTQVNEAFKFAEGSPFPDKHEAFTNVYAD